MNKGFVLAAAAVAVCVAGALAFCRANADGHRTPASTAEGEKAGVLRAERSPRQDEPGDATAGKGLSMEGYRHGPATGEAARTVRAATGGVAPVESGATAASRKIAQAGGSLSSGPVAPTARPRAAENSIADTPVGKEMQAKLLGQLKPILSACYQDELARAGSSEPDVMLSFDITIDPTMGAVVHTVEVTADAGAVDPDFVQCLQETVGTIAPFQATGPSSSTMLLPLSFRKQRRGN